MPHEARHSTRPDGDREAAARRTLPARGIPRRRSLLHESTLEVDVSSYDVSAHGAADPCCGVFVRGMQRGELRHVARRRFPCVETIRFDDLEHLGRIELSWRAQGKHDAVLVPGHGLIALLSVHSGACEVVVAGREASLAEAACEALEDALRREGPEDDNLYVDFWSASRYGPTCVNRQIEAPTWEEIELNYSATVRAALGPLIRADRPGAGSLVLWHGPPGTGKSHALRALALAWRGWCSTHYITDPENFLGSGTSYLMQVAVSHDDQDAEGEPRWRLLVLEDAGELIATSARSETGQALSRLLNVADGLLGQGARCILLITTNEPVGRLHPAVRRPGRCWSQIEFDELEVPEANLWLARHGCDAVVERAASLAELYAIREGRSLELAEGPPFGFADGV